MQILKETTDWSNAGYNVPNHTYVLNGDRCIGMVQDNGIMQKFHRPCKFYKKNRTFKKVQDKKITEFFTETC